MNLAPDDRVNMSLDAIIKTSQQAKKSEKKELAKKNPKVAASKGLAKTKPEKAAKSVAQNKAKRAAAVDQKRGLNATGKASTKQVKAAVKKQVAKAKKPAVKTSSLKKGTQTRPSGLRISFKPADLGKTTDKNMAAQIRGVLSKDPSSKKAAAAKPHTAQAGRKVVQAKAPPKKKIVIRR